MDRIRTIENEFLSKNDLPAFKAGDTVTVHYKIREGEKERIQQFQGTVLQRRGSGQTETFTVRKISGGLGVERIFPVHSPFIDKIDRTKEGAVRRARIFYMRDRIGKATRVKQKQHFGAKEGGKKKK